MEIRTKSNVEHGIVNRSANTFFKYHGWPSIAADDEGTLYVVNSGFRVTHVCPFGKTTMYKSFDGGKTWSIPMVINDTYLDDRDAGIISLGGKRLLVTWFSHPRDVYLKQYSEWIRGAWCGSSGVLDAYPTIPDEYAGGGSFIRISEDGGYTWGETIKVPISSPHGPIMQKNGDLLYLGRAMYTELEKPGTIAAYTSRDGGYTWERLGGVPNPEGYSTDCFHEPHVIELDDGRLLGMIRAEGRGMDDRHVVYHGFTMFKTYSSDGGRTWTTPVSIDVSGSPPHLLKHSSGAVVCVYGRREEPYGERAIITRDGGETWSDEYILHETVPGDLGYPASVELPDGSIFTVYYQRAEGDNFTSILYTHWRIEDYQ